MGRVPRKGWVAGGWGERREKWQAVAQAVVLMGPNYKREDGWTDCGGRDGEDIDEGL